MPNFIWFAPGTWPSGRGGGLYDGRVVVGAVVGVVVGVVAGVAVVG